MASKLHHCPLPTAYCLLPTMTELESSPPRSRFRLSLIGSLLGPFLALGMVFVLFGVGDVLRNE